MPLDLAALLVEAGAASSADLEAAVARQREAGGTLDSALLELELVEEGELLRLLTRASGFPPAPLDPAPDPRARRVLPARVAERHAMAPFRLEGQQLAVAAAHPVDVTALDELSFMLSLQIVPHVAPEWRVRELLSKVYGGPLPARMAALAVRVRAKEVAAQRTSPAPDRDRDRESDRDLEPDREPLTPTLSPARGEGGRDRDLTARFDPAAALFFGRADPEEPLAAALAQVLEGAEGEALLRGAFDQEAPIEAPPRWSRDQAFAALEAADGRDKVVAVALRYARDFFEAAALLAVTTEHVGGHDALGWPQARARCRSLRLDRERSSLLRAVLETRGPYLGPVARDPGNDELLAALGRAWPRTALLYPVVLRDRVVCILYADNGEAPVSPGRLGDLLLVAGALGVTFERILRQGKRDRSDAPPVAPSPAAEEPGDVTGLGAAEAVQHLLRSPPGSAGRARLVAHLAQLGPAAAAALREVFPGPLDGAEGDARTLEERGPVLAAFVALGPVGTSDLLALLAHGDPDQRRLAAGTLGRTGDPASFLPLADAALALDGAPGEAAVAALVALREHLDFRPVLPRLRKALLGPAPAAAARAASAVGRLGDADAVPLLVQALDMADPAPGAASAALEALTGLRAAGPAGWLAWWKARR